MEREKSLLLERLLPVVVGLYDETAGLAQGDGDLQLWYNRGYADGMARMFRELGYAAELAARVDTVPLELDDAASFLPWGKAYRHGFEMGERETREALAE